MAEQNIQRSDVSDWAVLGLRVTAFSQDPSSVRQEPGVWRQIVGESPEQQNFKPKTGEFLEEGPFLLGMLNFTFQPGRLEWRFGPLAEENVISPVPPLAGPVETVLAQFGDVIKKWIESSEVPIRRLAVGAHMLLPSSESDRETAYKKIANYLPSVSLDPSSSCDFLYQINRPRESHVVDKLRINRLSKWNVLAFTMLPMSLDLGVLIESSIIATAIHSPSVELDYNTAADRVTAISKDNLVSLYDELVAQILETLAKGDIS